MRLSDHMFAHAVSSWPRTDEHELHVVIQSVNSWSV